MAESMLTDIEGIIVKENSLPIPSGPIDIYGNETAKLMLMIYSGAIVPKPADWVDKRLVVTGIVTLESSKSTSQELPANLSEFMSKAKASKAPIVYIGMGSMLQLVIGPERGPTLLSNIGSAALKSGCYAIISTLGAPDTKVDLTRSGLDLALIQERAFVATNSLPHDLLFTQVDVVVHHGGAGTTHAACKGGASSIIIPCGPSSDQPWWGSGLKALGYVSCLLSFFPFFFFLSDTLLTCICFPDFLPPPSLSHLLLTKRC
jgi:sterol 3beta-glucosyltransferase